MGPIITYRQPLPKLIIRADNVKNAEQWIAKSSLYQQQADLDTKFLNALKTSGVTYISLIGEICNDSICKTISNNGSPMQFDYGHLTHNGAIDIIDNLIKKNIL